MNIKIKKIGLLGIVLSTFSTSLNLGTFFYTGGRDCLHCREIY